MLSCWNSCFNQLVSLLTCYCVFGSHTRLIACYSVCILVSAKSDSVVDKCSSEKLFAECCGSIREVCCLILHSYTTKQLKCGMTSKAFPGKQRSVLYVKIIAKGAHSKTSPHAMPFCTISSACITTAMLYASINWCLISVLTQKMTDYTAQPRVKGHRCSKVDLRELSGWLRPIEHRAASGQLHVNNQQASDSIQLASPWLKANRYGESCNRMFC